MVEVRRDGDDVFLVMKDHALAGWFKWSASRGRWRAYTVRGSVSMHTLRSDAVDAIVGYTVGGK